jgi:hypothetical protein
VKPLKSCVNGCNRPVQPPSKVLCKECFAKLDEQVHLVLGAAARPEDKETR